MSRYLNFVVCRSQATSENKLSSQKFPDPNLAVSLRPPRKFPLSQNLIDGRPLHEDKAFRLGQPCQQQSTDRAGDCCATFIAGRRSEWQHRDRDGRLARFLVRPNQRPTRATYNQKPNQSTLKIHRVISQLPGHTQQLAVRHFPGGRFPAKSPSIPGASAKRNQNDVELRLTSSANLWSNCGFFSGSQLNHQCGLKIRRFSKPRPCPTAIFRGRRWARRFPGCRCGSRRRRRGGPWCGLRSRRSVRLCRRSSGCVTRLPGRAGNARH
jgi:hypothetical protein